MAPRSRYLKSRLANFGYLETEQRPPKRQRADTLGRWVTPAIGNSNKENGDQVSDEEVSDSLVPEPYNVGGVRTETRETECAEVAEGHGGCLWLEEEGVQADSEPDTASEPMDIDPQILSQEQHTSEPIRKMRRKYIPPPTLSSTCTALKDLGRILVLKRPLGASKAASFADDGVLCGRLRMLQHFLNTYADTGHPVTWMEASERAARMSKKRRTTSENLRQWAHKFIANRNDLPFHCYGQHSSSLLWKDGLAKHVKDHLQQIGKYASSGDIVTLLDTPIIQEKYSLTKTISSSTAKRWFGDLDYTWGKAPSGQYVDGHERAPVVTYRDGKFLPIMAEVEKRMQKYTNDGSAEDAPPAFSEDGTASRQIVVWFHDECVFYANDRRQQQWVHKDAKVVPRAKGEGASLMVSDFISADFGWLQSADGQESARILLKPGKNRDGYFTNDQFLPQLENAIRIVKDSYPEFDHMFVLDNAGPHVKRPDDALSARKMSKSSTPIPQPGKPVARIFGVDVNVRSVDGKLVYGPDGKLLKQRVQMSPGTFANGDTQPLYYPSDHTDNPGGFKGMAEILKERGYQNVDNLRAECRDFNCPPPDPSTNKRGRCCCRRLLYEEDDFANVESRAEMLGKDKGVAVCFLPKFHCELNPIERCWAHAKQVYRLNPPSSAEADLFRNVKAALAAVPLLSMRRYVMSSFRYMAAYREGLNGEQAAHAHRKFKGHRTPPQSILRALDNLE